MAIAAARAGKDIWCEKPMTRTIGEGQKVVEAVRRAGRIFRINTWFRFEDTFYGFGTTVKPIKKIVDNRLLGWPLRITLSGATGFDWKFYWQGKTYLPPEPVPEELDYDFWLGPAPWRPYFPDATHFGWRFWLATGGGEMTDRGAHVLDLVQFITNHDNSGPVWLRASGRRGPSPIFDAFMDFEFEYRYSNGLRVYGRSEGDRGLKLIGTEGWIFIHIHGGRLEADPPSLLRERILPGERRTERSGGHHRNFLDAVRTRRRPIADHEIGHRTATICHLLNASMELGRTIRWDPVAERIIGDAEAQRWIARPMRAPWRI